MRIQINLSDDMNTKVTDYAKRFGVSKSQLCSMLVGQGILSYDKAFDMMVSVKDVVQEEMKNFIETVNEK